MMCYWSFTLNTIHNKDSKNQETADLCICQEAEAECDDFKQSPRARSGSQNLRLGCSHRYRQTRVFKTPRREMSFPKFPFSLAWHWDRREKTPRKIPTRAGTLTRSGRGLTHLPQSTHYNVEASQASAPPSPARSAAHRVDARLLTTLQKSRCHVIYFRSSRSPRATCPRHLDTSLKCWDKISHFPRCRNPWLSVDLAAFKPASTAHVWRALSLDHVPSPDPASFAWTVARCSRETFFLNT